MEAAKKISEGPLGRLKSLGINHPFQAAFLLPTGWQDMREPLTNFNTRNLPDGPRLINGFLETEPKTNFNKAPHLLGSLKDENGYRIKFSKFGDTQEFKSHLMTALKANHRFSLYGEISTYNGDLWLKDAILVNKYWVGKMRPVYPGKVRVINPDTVRVQVLSILHERQNLEKAAQWLLESLQGFGDSKRLMEIAKCPEWSMNQLIWFSHFPQDPAMAKQATEGIERLAGLGVLQQAKQNTPHIVPGFQIDKKKAVVSYRSRLKSFPFEMTDEQKKAVGESITDLMGALPAKRFLSGDVGTGKTVVYGMAASICADQGGRVAILLPSTVLANQIGRELHSYWPDIPMQIVTGNTQQIRSESQILIGTTALLFQATDKDFDFVIVDEQHKFSRDQREKLLQRGTHLLEVSATCIPRSQALMKFGFLKISKLTKCHVEKHIETVIRTIADKETLFKDIKKTIDDGGQVLVVYPKKSDDPEKDSDLPALEEALPGWDRAFPGQVAMIHSNTPDDQKEEVMKKMMNKEASILLATTVVEVGVNLPNIKRVTIMHADRHGLSGLHQLRGRAARTGGKGYCDLYLPIPAKDIKDKVKDRLDVLVKTNDGFKVAEEDLRLRGAGDLSTNSEKQSGADETFLFGRGVNIDILEQLIDALPCFDQTIQKQETKQCPRTP